MRFRYSKSIRVILSTAFILSTAVDGYDGGDLIKLSPDEANSTLQQIESGNGITKNTLEWPFGASFACKSFPIFCNGLLQLQRLVFPTETTAARGPKDLIAIILTLLATLLGAILVKLNVLIVLSLISVGIGKLLLFVFALKLPIFAHKTHQQPQIVYEKVYYPHHHHDRNDDNEFYSKTIGPQAYREDYEINV